MNNENKIFKLKNILYVLFEEEYTLPRELQYLADNFCGEVSKGIEDISKFPSDKRIYKCALEYYS